MILTLSSEPDNDINISLYHGFGRMTGLDDILAGLKAAGEGTRFRLLALFTKAELTVSEVTQILRQSQPRVSRHLKLMSDAGLIERIREGTWVFYRLAEAGAG